MRYTRLGRGRLGVLMVLVLLASLLTPLTAFAAPLQGREGSTEWVQVYTVQRGDTLAGIAWSFGVSEEALMEANSLRNPNVIYVGQQLIIPENGGSGKGGPQCAEYHTVVRGDTLTGIAVWHGVDEYVLARANGIVDLNDIYVGQDLCIPAVSGGNYHPQQPSYEPERPQYDGCSSPCGQPQNEGPKNDGPQRPSDGPQRPDDSGCSSPCGQPQNEGPKNDGPQRPDDGGCNNPCGQPQNEGPKNDGPQRPSDGPGCSDPCDGPGCSDPCDGPGCSDPCDGPRRDDDYKPEPMRPTEYWKGSYFNDKYFSEFVLERQDLEINFNWFTGSPFGELNQDRFSVRWEKVEYFKGGPYRFYATADDGVRVYVDDQLVIDGWVIQPATDYKADLNLGEGPHKIVVEYYEEAEDAQIRVYWEPRRPTK